MVMVTRLRTDNAIATTKRTNDVVHRDTRVTVPLYNCICIKYVVLIRVITKLPNSEQSYKGKVKTHMYINRQNQSTTGKL